VPTDEQIAALAAALTALREGERMRAPEPVPPAYRSRWRRAAIEGAVAPWSRR
jgi:hypothetical protein